MIFQILKIEGDDEFFVMKDRKSDVKNVTNTSNRILKGKFEILLKKMYYYIIHEINREKYYWELGL